MKFLRRTSAAYCRRLRQIAAEETLNPPGNLSSESLVDGKEEGEERRNRHADIFIYIYMYICVYIYTGLSVWSHWLCLRSETKHQNKYNHDEKNCTKRRGDGGADSEKKSRIREEEATVGELCTT